MGEQEAPEAGRRETPARADTEYLALLGERIRALRSRRGMTRRILAQDSGVSQRYLAQLESGEGNISIVLLRQVARAMDVPLADLVSDAPERPVELALLYQYAARLTPEQMAEARRLLVSAFGGTPAAQRSGRIALIGLRGAGKTTLGRMLAARRNLPFVEIGREIEREAGMDLAELFSLGGQKMYRRYERRALERAIAEHEQAVIATGGSLVSEPANYEILLSSCYTIWVSASAEEHMARVIAQGDRRPMADNPEAMADLRRILTDRAPLYAKADAHVDTAGHTPEESFKTLLETLAP